MEYLRWILLAGGILFVIIIYLLGRRHRQNAVVTDEFDDEELPSFSARDWDELDEGVGEVRIIARNGDEDLELEEQNKADALTTSNHEEQSQSKGPGDAPAVAGTRPDTRLDDTDKPTHAATEHKGSLVIVLYIIAQPDSKLAGDRINTAVRANGLVYGDMNIFHRLDPGGKPVYSLANMLEPGTFDPVTIHDMRTPGVIMFMQLPGPPDPLACFNDMLQIAYRITEMLDARLCNSRREKLTEADTENLRAKVGRYVVS